MFNQYMKKIVSFGLAASLAASLCLTGCSNDETPDTTTQAPTASTEGTAEQTQDSSENSGQQSEAPEESTQAPAALRDVIAPKTDYVTDEMYERANNWELVSNFRRLADVMKRAEDGESITVGVIGGSITQGSSATKTENTYAQIMYSWWKETFPNSEINFVNAGIGATDSYLGVHRVETDLLSYEPDFIIVEFSVNDANTVIYKKTYENLVRRILSSETEPAVMLLFMTQEDGTSAQDNHSNIGFNYKLPMLSYRQAILKEIEDGAFTWKDISPDNIHPNDRGHALLGELIWKYLNMIYADLDTHLAEDPYVIPEKPVTSYVYENAMILDNTSITPDSLGTFTEGSSMNNNFPNGWSNTEGDGGITFTVEAKNIGMIYYMTVNGTGGQFEVYVDGEYVTTLDADFTDGWGSYATTKELITFDEIGTHTIEIKKAENSTGDTFAILGWLIS